MEKHKVNKHRLIFFFFSPLISGAAFSAGLTGGISTSIAVFCHELPHELGNITFKILPDFIRSKTSSIIINASKT